MDVPHLDTDVPKKGTISQKVDSAALDRLAIHQPTHLDG